MSGILGRTLTLYIRDSSSVYRLVGQVQTKNFSHERSLVNISDEIGQTHALNLNSGLRSISIGLSGVVPTTSATNIVGYNLLKTAAMGVSDDPLTFKLTSDDIRIDGTGFISSFSETGQVSGAILYSASLMLDTSPTIDLAPVGVLDLGSCVVVPFAIAGGTANALTATFTGLTLVDGAEVKLRAAFANTATAPTLSSNGGTPVVITRLGNQALRAGDIDSAGHEMTLRYVIASPVRWELLNPANADLFWSAPIGTVIEAPTAPSDGGTWFECTGQALSQTTYSTLYALLGHSWARFKTDGVGSLLNNDNSTGRFFHTGSGNYFYANDGVSTFVSSDGITWTAKASIGTPASYSMTTDGGTTWLLWNITGNTGGRRSTDGATTWSAVTFPAAFKFLSHNGTNFLGYIGSGTTVYSSADGITWSTHTTVLPFNFQTGRLFWDGSFWIVLEETSTSTGSVFKICKTSTSNGSSGWSTVTDPAVKYGALAGIKTSSGEVITVSGKNCLASTAQFATNTKEVSANAPHPNATVWNGYVYLASCMVDWWETYGNNFNPVNSGLLLVSTNGRHWNMIPAPVMTGAIGGLLYITSPRESNSSTWCANTSNGDVMVGLVTRTDSLTTPNCRYSALLKFDFTVGTQFCVPTHPGTTPKWIKAL